METILNPALSLRLLETVATLLVLAPFANVYFLFNSVQRYRHDPGRSPFLEILVVTKAMVFLIGVLMAILAGFYLAQPRVAPTTPTGVLFGLGLLLVQLLPLYIYLRIRNVERGR